MEPQCKPDRQEDMEEPSHQTGRWMDGRTASADTVLPSTHSGQDLSATKMCRVGPDAHNLEFEPPYHAMQQRQRCENDVKVSVVEL